MQKKGIVAWVKEILHKESPLPEVPDEKVVTSLLNRAAQSSTESEGNDASSDDGNDRDTGNDGNDGNDGNAPDENKEEKQVKKESCPYALKRNIVASLQEIRRFAEEHNLASTMVKALLTLLADMAVNALKGKVSGAVLESLLKIFNFEKEKEEAYRRGELDGRNARIKEEFFACNPEDIPHLGGAITKESDKPNIFSMAREA